MYTSSATDPSRIIANKTLDGFNFSIVHSVLQIRNSGESLILNPIKVSKIYINAPVNKSMMEQT
jgi:hypothetical protein